MIGHEFEKDNGVEAATPQVRAARILLAEDNIVNQRVAARLLEKRGHSVVIVGTGREALSALRNENFDLVLMDIQMPEMDGFEATRAIREEESGTNRHIPIIAMTAHAMTGDRDLCLAAGMDDYISKPIRPSDLINLLKRTSATPANPATPTWRQA